jgi:hypothetical protein
MCPHQLQRWMSVFGVWLVTVTVSLSVSAGEKIQWHSQHINVSTRFDRVEVGDEPGHIIAMFEAKGVGIRRKGVQEPPYKIEIWGTGDYREDGTGKEHGYGKFTFEDGASYYEEWTGKVANRRSVGTAVYFNGSGRFEGMKGGSKYECSLLGDRFICEVEGTVELR